MRACSASLLTLFSVWTQGSESWRNPTSLELNLIFEWATRDVPDQMLLEGVIQISEPPLSQQEVLEIYKRRSASSVSSSRRLTNKEQNEQKKKQLSNLERRFSGTRTRTQREWYSRAGMLYRIDSLDHQALIEDSILRTNIETGAIEYPITEVGINAPSFLENSEHPAARRLRINHGIQSGSIKTTTSSWDDEPEFWQAMTLEPELAFPIASLLMATNSIPSSPTFRKSMSGLQPNPDRIQEAATGQVKGWTFEAREEELDGQKVTHLRVKSEKKSLFSQVLNAMAERHPLQELKQDLKDASIADYAYYFDHHDPPRLLRAVKIVPRKHHYVSERKNYNKSGFPLLWRTRVEDLEKETTVTTSRSFSTANLEPNFPETETFGLKLLDLLILVEHDGKLIEDRSGFDPRFIINDQPSTTKPPRARSQATRTLFLLFLMIPAWFIIKSRSI